jgi:TPR repeat protein
MAPAPVARPKTPPAEKRAATREPGVTSAKASNSSTPATADTGDPDFRKGEAYLYGRGAQKNCNEAVKYLKAASAKSNAKARSAFGTMYATGHCVQRDLPTSYLWFALALRVDPNNQILEKDLNAVWNQMTPPERQMATRMKQ